MRRELAVGIVLGRLYREQGGTDPAFLRWLADAETWLRRYERLGGEVAKLEQEQRALVPAIPH